LKNQNIKILFTPIFLQLHIAEDTQKDALDIFTHIIESQEKILNKNSLFATCLIYCVHRQNNYAQLSIQDYCKTLQEHDLNVIPRAILRDMIRFSGYIKKPY
jgi:transcription termination factor NusB